MLCKSSGKGIFMQMTSISKSLKVFRLSKIIDQNLTKAIKVL